MDDDQKLVRFKPIATLEVDRQLGGSKSRKSGKTFAGKESKGSPSSSKASRKSTKSAKSSASKSEKSSGHTSGNKIFSRGKSNKSGKNNSAKALEGSSKSSKSSHPAPKPQPPAPAPVSSKVAENQDTPPPSAPATGAPRQDHSSSSTNTGSTENETVTQFLEDNGDYTGLHTQNIAVGISAFLALLATVVGVAVKRKRTASTDNNDSDSVETSPVASVKKPVEAPNITNAALVDNTDYPSSSCTADFFGLTSCWV